MNFSSADITYRISSIDIHWYDTIDETCECQMDNCFIFFLRGCDTECFARLLQSRWHLSDALLFFPYDSNNRQSRGLYIA